jgi:hypothetical protein
MLEGLSIEGIFLVPSEDMTEGEEPPLYCVYSSELDSVTFVGAEERDALAARGARHTDALPE